MATGRRIRTRLAALALAGLAALGLTELGLRVAGFRYPCFYRADPARGWALRPGAEGLYTREGRGHVRVNSLGLRGPERPTARTPGTARLLILGDSYTAAFEVDEEQALCARLEALVDPAPFGAERVEVWNLGVPGYGTAQEWLTLEAALAFEPDAVLLLVCAGNDVRNNSRVLEPVRDRPFYRLADGRLEPDDAFRDSTRYRLRSWLYALAGHTRLGEAAWRFRSEGRGGAARAAGGEVGLDEAIYLPAEGPWSDAWEVTGALLERMHSACERAGVFFGAVAVSNGIQVHPDPSVRAAFRQRLGVEDLFAAERRLADLGARHGFPVLALAPPLAARAEAEGTWFHGFDPPGSGHWNATGHAAAAELVAAWLRERVRRP